MVDIIASRAAALRLSWIFAALMVPILFFGYFMASTLFGEAKLAKREHDGAELIHLLIPIYVGAAAENIDQRDVAVFLQDGPAYAQNIGVAGHFDQLAEVLKNPKPMMASVLLDAHELVDQIAGRSDMILDAEAEAYHLAVSTVQGIPILVDRFKKLQESSKHALVNGSFSADGLAQILVDSGMLKQAAGKVVADIHTANQISNYSNSYSPMIKVSDIIEARISDFTRDIRNNFVHPETMAPATFLQVTQMAKPILDEYRGLWSQANSRFTLLLEQRQSAISRKVGNLILIGVACVLLGLGLAIGMFRSTFRRLDGVELARREAVDARSEAEALANSISTINEDVVRMNHELAENMGKLKNAQDELVKKGRMEQMGQLTATIAHELRNPLGAVRTSAFLIERKIRDKGLGVEPQLARINNGITRCDNIITQLLDFSRTKQLSARADDLDQWLAKTIEEEAKSLPSAVEIQCNLGLDGLQVPFDPSRLQRAIINLVSNASEAMVGNGEDVARFTVANPVITICSQALGNFALITVADNGPGISPEDLLKIREPLFTTKSFGTGLGIPAVEQIATQHGGALEISSELGKGAAFTIKIPLTRSEEVAA